MATANHCNMPLWAPRKGPATSQSDGTALVAAAITGMTSVMRLLLGRGADIEAADKVSRVAAASAVKWPLSCFWLARQGASRFSVDVLDLRSGPKPCRSEGPADQTGEGLWLFGRWPKEHHVRRCAVELLRRMAIRHSFGPLAMATWTSCAFC